MTDEQNREQLNKEEEEQHLEDLQKLLEEIESGIKGLKEGKYRISDDIEMLLKIINDHTYT